MKIKQHVVLTQPAQFLKGNYSSCFTLFDYKTGIDGWIDCGEVTLNIEVDSDDVIRVATQDLDEQISKANAVLSVLETRKAELLALPAPNEVKPYHEYDGYPAEETQDEIHQYENSRVDKS